MNKENLSFLEAAHAIGKEAARANFFASRLRNMRTRGGKVLISAAARDSLARWLEKWAAELDDLAIAAEADAENPDQLEDAARACIAAGEAGVAIPFGLLREALAMDAPTKAETGK